MAPRNELADGHLVIRTNRSGDPCFDAKWRRDGRQRMRRIGPAWVERDGAGWRPRRGRAPAGAFTAKAAILRMAELIAVDADDASRAAEAARAARERGPTFRHVAHEWLEWVGDVKGARASTLRDYGSILAEPDAAHKTGRGRCRGRVMAALGDRPISEITSREISAFLRTLDKTDLSTRTINKQRQVLSAIFNFACRDDTYELPANPVSRTDKRREPPAAALDFFEPDEIEQLARAAADGQHRLPANGRGGLMDLSEDEIALRCGEDAQDAEAIRVLAYTGLRIGEAVALRWSDVDLENRRLIVQRALSHNVEGPTKSWQVRYVPLANPAHAAFERLKARIDFTGRDDYVFCNRVGGRLDPSAFRRRYHAAREAAGLRRVKLHGLRHGAGSLIARETDPVFVQHFLGHAKLATTERYMHAKARREDIDKINRAFSAPQDITAE